MNRLIRQEINGLRAISIVSIIFYNYHIKIFDFELFKGGFIGIDIFFVISGYLITLNFLKEINISNTISIKNFYKNRIRRVLPLLLVVVFGTFPLAWMFLLSIDFLHYSKSVFSTLSFSSNFFFHYSGNRFAEISSLSKPLIHTWSISVLVQFYILYPLILLIILKFFKKYLIHILILGFCLSLGVADWGSKYHPSFNYYVLPTRTWELLTGSIIAYYEIKIGRNKRHNYLSNIFVFIGLLSILYSFVFFTNKSFYPSFYTLIPIIGTSLILWFSNEKAFVTKFISLKIFVWIGLISFSLYMWHYPIIAFDTITEFSHGNLIKQFLLFLALISLSIFTYLFIELPSRNIKIKFNSIASVIIVITTLIFFLNLSVISNKGYENRMPEILHIDTSQRPWWFLKNSQNEGCIDNIKFEFCKFNESSKNKIIIIGDSHLGALTHDLKDKIIKKNYQFVTSINSSCMYLPGFNLIDIRSLKVADACNNKYFTKIKKYLSDDENNVIIFGGRLPLYFSGNYFNNQEGGIELGKYDKKFAKVGKHKTIQDSFKKEILELQKKNKIVLIYPIPEVSWDINKKIYIQWLKKKNKSIKDFKPHKITTSYDVYKDRTKFTFKYLNSIKGKNIFRVYPHKLFCDNFVKNRCITHDNKNIFYFDDNHLSLSGASLLNDMIIKKIEMIYEQ